ncbi:hypothetical protein MKEN_01153900 [Mycena kentingensis (nom. inval.)]|nr:hypothetical protein MKEN_01153900 [Mycena kentingensis (nom. inval.)]
MGFPVANIRGDEPPLHVQTMIQAALQNSATPTPNPMSFLQYRVAALQGTIDALQRELQTALGPAPAFVRGDTAETQEPAAEQRGECEREREELVAFKLGIMHAAEERLNRLRGPTQTVSVGGGQ